MDLNDSPAKQYRSLGEKTPGWLIFCLIALGIIGCVTAAWLIYAEWSGKGSLPWPWRAEVGTNNTQAAPPVPPGSIVIEPPQTPVKIPVKESPQPAVNSPVTHSPQAPEDSAMAAKVGPDNAASSVPPASAAVEPSQNSGERNLLAILEQLLEKGTPKEQAKVASVPQSSPAKVPDCPALFTVTFASESVSPQGPADFKEKLIQLRDWLSAHRQAKLLIEGHADIWGDRQFNLQLSEKRAKAVASLLAEAGVPREQLVTRALGAGRLPPGNRSGSRNRRVSLQIEGAQGCPQTEGDTP